MSFINEIHSKKTLAVRYGISSRQMYRRLKIMLSDKEVRKEFGRYTYPFTPKQLSIITENIGLPPEKDKLP